MTNIIYLFGSLTRDRTQFQQRDVPGLHANLAHSRQVVVRLGTPVDAESTPITGSSNQRDLQRDLL